MTASLLSLRSDRISASLSGDAPGLPRVNDLDGSGIAQAPVCDLTVRDWESRLRCFGLLVRRTPDSFGVAQADGRTDGRDERLPVSGLGPTSERALNGTPKSRNTEPKHRFVRSSDFIRWLLDHGPRLV